MRLGAWVFSSVAAACAFGVPAAGLAEPVPEPVADPAANARRAADEARMAAAKALYYAGNKAAANDFLAEAIKSWRAAWELAPMQYEIACDIGRAALRAGHFRDAAEFLSICVVAAPAAINAEEINAEEKKRETDEREELATARLAVGALRIEVSEPGAEVAIDGCSVGRSPLPGEVFVDPGKHRVTATLAGRAPAAEAIDIPKGSSRTVTFRLQLPAPRAPAADKATAGEDKAAAGRLPPWVIGGGSVLSGGLVIAGAIFTLERQAAGEESLAATTSLGRTDPHRGCAVAAAQAPPACGVYGSAMQSQELYRVLGPVSFIAAGAVATTTVLLFVYSGGRVKVAVSPGSAAVVGTF